MVNREVRRERSTCGGGPELERFASPSIWRKARDLPQPIPSMHPDRNHIEARRGKVMALRSVRWQVLALLLVGCASNPSRPCIDAIVCDLALKPRDEKVLGAPVVPAGHVAEAKADDPKAGMIERLVIPRDLPGADTQKLDLPPGGKGNEEKRKAALKQLYPGLADVGTEVAPGPGPDGKPLTLAALQALALSNSPVLRQAVARVEAARGAMVQAGLPPNPTIGVVGNTIGTEGTAGQIGPYFEQVIKLGNKLGLARAVALMELRLAEIAQRKAEMDLLTGVRRGFFKVLVAQEAIRVLRAMELMASRIHDLHVEQLTKGGEVAPYEPLQTRVQVTQARAALVQARHQLLAAWRQMAAQAGLPGMQVTEIAANLNDMPLPCYEYGAVLGQVLQHHTDLMTAEAGVLKARNAIALAKAQAVPDLQIQVQLTPDFTTRGTPLTPTVQAGFTNVPLWNRNQGGIAEAEAALIAADEAMPAARNDLTSRVADAYNRYASYRTQVVYLREGVLPDQVRAYRALRDRYIKDPSVPDSSQPNLQDVINAQQNVLQSLNTYVANLDSFAMALIDLADLLQTDDLYLLASGRSCLEPLGLDLVEEHRPCSPVDSRPLQVPANSWPVVTPALRP